MAGKKVIESGSPIRVAASNEVTEEQMHRVHHGKRAILLIRWEGTVFAVDASCPHAAADLGKGSLHRWKLTCADHDYCFDIRSGNIIWPDDELYRLQRYPVHEENGSIYIQID